MQPIRVKVCQESDLRMLGLLARNIQRVLPVTQADIDAAAALGKGWVVWKVIEVSDPLDNLRGGTQLIIKQNSVQPGQNVRRVIFVSGPGGETVVIGPAPSPLLLPDAIANSLHYVKAFGGTENITYQDLPSGYTPVQYIDMKPGSYLLTNIIPTYDGHYELDFQTTQVQTSAWWLGGRTVPYGGMCISTNNNSQFRFDAFGTSNDDRWYTNIIPADNTRYKFVYNNKDATIYQNNNIVGTHTFTNTSANGAALAILANNTNGTIGTYSNVGMYVYSFRAWDNQGNMIANYIPCITGNPATAVFFDLVSKTPITPTQGTWSAGPTTGAYIVPIPESPVVIGCNNGILKVKDSELPLGYKRLTGITYDSNTYYETNEKLYGSDTLTITLSGTVSAGRNVIGAYSGSGDDARNFSLYIYGGGSSSNSYFRHGTKTSRPKYGTGTRTLVMSPTGTDGFLNNVTYEEEDFETTSTFRIGTLPNSTSAKFDGNMIGNITVSNRLKYIPCERVSDGEIGYYEIFTDTFLEPQGNGTPVSMGYDTSYMTEVYVDGTVETIVANSKNYFTRDGETTGQIITSDGTVSNNSNYSISAPFTLPAGDYTCTWNVGSGARPFSIYKCDADGNIILTDDGGRVIYNGSAVSGVNTDYFTLDSTTLVRSSYRNNATNLAIFSTSSPATAEMLLKVGDYADVQEILSGNITRNVGIKVLTGDENFETATATNCYSLTNTLGTGNFADRTIVCSHFDSTSTLPGTGDRQGLAFIVNKGPDYTIAFGATTQFSTQTQWKKWLAAQAAAGTPVIVIYPLATATTESVAGQTLQVQDGDNTLEITQASMSGLQLEAEYEQGVEASVEEIEP